MTQGRHCLYRTDPLGCQSKIKMSTAPKVELLHISYFFQDVFHEAAVKIHP